MAGARKRLLHLEDRGSKISDSLAIQFTCTLCEHQSSTSLLNRSKGMKYNFGFLRFSTTNVITAVSPYKTKPSLPPEELSKAHDTFLYVILSNSGRKVKSKSEWNKKYNQTYLQVKSLFYRIPSDFRNSVACWNIPRLRLFVHLVRASCGSR